MGGFRNHRLWNVQLSVNNNCISYKNDMIYERRTGKKQEFIIKCHLIRAKKISKSKKKFFSELVRGSYLIFTS